MELLDKERYIQKFLHKQEQQTKIYGTLGLKNFSHWQNNNEEITDKMLIYGRSTQYRQLQLLNKCFDFWEQRNSLCGSFESEFLDYRYKTKHTFRQATKRVCQKSFIKTHSKFLKLQAKNYYDGIRATLYLSSLNVSRRKQDEVRKIVSMLF